MSKPNQHNKQTQTKKNHVERCKTSSARRDQSPHRVGVVIVTLSLRRSVLASGMILMGRPRSRLRAHCEVMASTGGITPETAIERSGWEESFCQRI
jgi:hypothetical protein